MLTFHDPRFPDGIDIISAQLSSYFPAIIMSLLTRLQTNKTDKFSNLFTYFIMYIIAVRVEGLTPDILIDVMENIQAGYGLEDFTRKNLVTNFLIAYGPTSSAVYFSLKSPKYHQRTERWQLWALHVS